MNTDQPTYQKLLHLVAQVISIVFYPMLIPTYGMILFCLAIRAQLFALPAGYCVIICVATLAFTCLIPLSLILFMFWRGQIPDLYISDARLRTMPYLYSIMGFVFWCWFVGKNMHAPRYLLWTAIGATIALVIVLIINRRWKISAHLAAMGGLLGGICSYALANNLLPLGLIIIVLGVSLGVMYARLYLNAHTALQVVGGYLLGILCTFIPNWLIYA